MVLGIGALATLGLALPTGLAFGYGYGYGVRQGYSAFKPPSKTANDLKMSTNPVTGGLGAGLQSAEERTGVKTPVGSLTGEPSLIAESAKLTGQKWIVNKCGKRINITGIHDRETVLRLKNQKCSRRKYSQKGKYRY